MEQLKYARGSSNKNLNVKEFNKICRACLANNEMKSIFAIKYGNATLVNVFNKLTGLNIIQNDGMPENICSVCVSSIIQAQMFVDQCQESNKILKSMREIKLKIEESINPVDPTITEKLKVNCKDITQICFVDCNENGGVSFQEFINDSQCDSLCETDTNKKSSRDEPEGFNPIDIKNIKLEFITNTENEDICSKIEEIVYVEEVASIRKYSTKNYNHKWNCITCLKKYTSSEDLKQHYKKNSNCRPRLFKCNECDKAFYKKSKLEEHTRTHTKEFPFMCHQCPKTFRFPQNLTRHKKIHLESKPYSCNKCDKSFTRKTARDEHMRNHTGEAPYVCNYCGKTFKRYATHYLHIKRHKIKNGEKVNVDAEAEKVRCEKCYKWFANKWSLKTHMDTHSGQKNYTCNKCGKEFVTRNAMHSHMKIHLDVKPYACTECDKRFAQKCALKSHNLTHSGEFPFKCDVCCKKFRQNSQLKIHIRTHTQERPYRCTYCDKYFNTKSNLDTHTKIHIRNIQYSRSEYNGVLDNEDNLKANKVVPMQNASNIEIYNLACILQNVDNSEAPDEIVVYET